MPIIRTERTEVLWAAETTFGTIGSAPYARFGIHDTVEAPDPEFAWEPHFGVFSTRERATIMRGQASLRGSIPDIRLLSGAADGSAKFLNNHVFGTLEGAAQLVNPFTLFVGYRDTGNSKQLSRYYTGGKINRATLSAAEGQEARLSIDEMLFMDLQTTRNSGNDPFDAADPAVDPGATTGFRYMFAHGTVIIDGITFDRIRRFSLTLDNQIEPRYYIQRDATTAILHPNDLIEGRRVLKLEIDIDIVNPASGGDLELWDFLVNQAAADSGLTGATIGGQISLLFSPVGSIGGTLAIVCGGNPSATDPSGVILSASHNIPAPPTGVVTVTASWDINTVTVGAA